MSRNSLRSLLFALAVIVTLGAALPASAAGGPGDHIPAVQNGLLASFHDWLADLWSVLSPGVPRQGTELQTAQTAVTNNPGDLDRGIMIDPNGSPGGR